MGREIRHAWAVMRRRPQFAVVAILTLALGVSVNLLMFQVANEVLLRPLPLAEPEHLMSLGNRWDGLGYEHSSLSYPEMVEYREVEAFLDTGGFRWTGMNFTAGEGDPVQATGLIVTPNLPGLLGVEPALGRAFVPEDGEQGALPVALLSHRLWTERFGADDAVVGRMIELGGESTEVIGVLPPFDFPNRDVDFWTAVRIDGDSIPSRGWRSWTAFGRLAPGASEQTARNQMRAFEAVMTEREASYSTPEWGWSSSVRSVRDSMVGDVRPVLLLLLGAVGVVALVAATNIANLFLSRVSERRRELAIRTAIGATRGQVSRQLMFEAGVLSVAAAVVGASLSMIAGRLFGPVIASRLGVETLHFDARVLAFAVLLCVAIGLVLGAVSIPAALRFARISGLRGRSEDRGVATTRRLLVVAQLAVALALMVTAGLVLRSLDVLLAVETGFVADDAARASITLDAALYPELEARKAALERILESVRSRPGVESAGLTSVLPLTQLNDNSIHVLDSESISPETVVFPQIRVVSPGYFETLRVETLAGRLFDATDREGASRVAVVNATFAQRYYESDALGRRFSFGLGEGSIPMEIVGVVADTKEGTLAGDPRAVYYLPMQQIRGNGAGSSAILVARGRDAESAATAIRTAVRESDPQQSIYAEAPLSELVDEASAAERAQSVLLAAFALVAALLSAIGVYGVLSYTLQQERRDVGLRLALGALPGQVVRWMVGRGFVLALAGVGVGLLLAVLAARAVRSQLFGVSAFDPFVFVSVVVLVVGVALGAAWLPARRAAKVDPLITLRAD